MIICYFTAFVFSCSWRNVDSNKEIGVEKMAENSSSVFGNDDLFMAYSNALEKHKNKENNNKVTMNPLFLDTISDDFSVQYLFKNNQELLVRGSSEESNLVQYFDTEIIFNLSKGGIVVLKNKTFRRHDFLHFLEDEDLNKFIITKVSMGSLSPNGCLLELMICQPDTDHCFAYKLEIDHRGEVNIEELELDYSEDW
jgi:hypothetical protein